MVERKILRSLVDVEQWFSELTAKVIAFDTETSSLRYDDLIIYGMSIFDSRRICYINFFNNPESENILSYLRVRFSQLSGLVGHNLSYDLMVLSKYSIPWEHCKLFDTMVAFHLIDEEAEKGLKVLAREYLGVENPITFEQASEDGFETQRFCDYAMNDSYYTGRLYVLFKSKLEENDLQELMRLEMQFLPCVVEMQVTGFLVDTKKVQEIKESLEQKVFDLQVEMCEMLKQKYTIIPDLLGDIKIETETNFNSGKQIGRILFDKLGLPVQGVTPTGIPETGRETLEKLRGKHPFVDKLALFKKCQKLLSSFVYPLPSLLGKDQRVRAKFNVCGTVTGRLSSDNPNLQQLPKKNKELAINVRDIFIASPGYTMITCDYSGQEMRVLAEVSEDATLIDAFQQGKDLHLATAKAVFGCDIPEDALYEKNKEELDKYKEQYKRERDKSKVVNFGIAYGKGPQGFASDFNITPAEAEDIINTYFSGMPTVKKAIDLTTNEVKTQGYVRTMAGRLRRFKKISKDGQEFYTREMFRQAFNFKIQGYSADMMRKALVAVRTGRKPEWDLRFLASVHDEGVFEVKNKYLEPACDFIKTAFEGAVKLKVPVKAEIGTGNSYGKAK